MTSFFNRLAARQLALLAALTMMGSCGLSHAGSGGVVVVESGLGRMCQSTSGIPRVTFTLPVEETCVIGRATLLSGEEDTQVVQGLEWRTSGLTVTEVGSVQLDCDEWWRRSLEDGAIEVPAPSEDIGFTGALTASLVERGQFVALSGEFVIRTGPTSRIVEVRENRLWTGHGCF